MHKQKLRETANLRQSVTFRQQPAQTTLAFAKPPPDR